MVYYDLVSHETRVFTFTEVDGGVGRACRGSTSNDNQPSYYRIMDAETLQAWTTWTFWLTMDNGHPVGSRLWSKLHHLDSGFNRSLRFRWNWNWSKELWLIIPMTDPCIWNIRIPTFAPFLWPSFVDKYTSTMGPMGLYATAYWVAEWLLKALWLVSKLRLESKCVPKLNPIPPYPPISKNDWLVVTGTMEYHGILNDFPETVGNGIMIHTDFHSIIFQRG